MKRVRGFEVISNFENQGIKLPKRSTKASAGYDIRSRETITVPSYIQQSWLAGASLENLFHSYSHDMQKSIMSHEDSASRIYTRDFHNLAKILGGKAKPVLVHTGIKAYFPKHEALMLYNRSSNPIKRGLYLANGVGVTDSDYYNNPSNKGEIMAEFINLSSQDYTIHKGDRIAQCVFQPYLLVDNDQTIGKRTGGLGSTGK